MTLSQTTRLEMLRNRLTTSVDTFADLRLEVQCTVASRCIDPPTQPSVNADASQSIVHEKADR